MKKFSLFLFSLILVVFLAACGGGEESTETANEDNESASEETDVIKIGSLHPLTGAQASEGQEMRDAVQLAIDEVNENGGIEGKKVEIVVGDSENNIAKGDY